jgi:hypothetical protein
MGKASQEFNQKVCHKFGWSAQFDTDDQGNWCVDVTVGFDDKRHFVSNCKASTVTDEGKKEGKEAVCQVALEGLQKEVEGQEAKPQLGLGEFFTQKIAIYNSNQENWDYFWKHRPAVVGIDTEGNQKAPPVLVQIATDEYTILEIPKSSISENLKRLLQDDRVIKVFCDNFSQHDKKCLDLGVFPENDYTKGSILDLEAMAAELLGPVSVARGLARITTMCMPELNVILGKPRQAKKRFSSIGRFALIEQGKMPPLRGLHDLTPNEKQYAALDAWCTLQAYKRLKAANKHEPAAVVSK